MASSTPDLDIVSVPAAAAQAPAPTPPAPECPRCGQDLPGYCTDPVCPQD